MSMIRKISLFASRWVKARKCGFYYNGTTKTPYPEMLIIGGTVIPLLPPLGNECVYDLFNVLLDDEYGLSNIKKPAVIVDIGVNMGFFSLAAWSRYREAKVYGYEPGPDAFARASHNLKSTGATLFNEAVGLAAGMCTISDSTQSRLSRALVTDSGNIPVVPFSEVVRRAGGTIDLLKMDCEGAEWEILKDHDSMRFVRSIRMEYHLDGKRSLDDFKKLIAAGNHRITRLVQDSGFGIAWLENTLSV
jgi:FkbM family methyltransferase